MKPAKARRCSCRRPATHRLKNGVNTMFKLWTPQGEFPLRRRVNLPALCEPCAKALQSRYFGGRVYRWRTLPGGAR